jgi:hypothetical protein
MVCVGPLAVWLEAVVDLVRLCGRIGTRLLQLQNIHVYDPKNIKGKVLRDLLPLYVHCEEANSVSNSFALVAHFYFIFYWDSEHKSIA